MTDELMNMTAEQKNKWKHSIAELTALNDQIHSNDRRIDAIWNVLKWYKGFTGKHLANFGTIADLLTPVQNENSDLKERVKALNFALLMAREKKVGVKLSDKYPGDFDIVTRLVTRDPDIENATFRRPDTSFDGLGIAPFIPLLIKGGMWLVGSVLVYGSVSAIAESHTTAKRIDAKIAGIQADVDKEVLKQPAKVQKGYFQHKKDTFEPGDWISSLQKTGGSILMFAVVAMAGYFIFKNYSGGSKK
jgi:hypothetical protein